CLNLFFYKDGRERCRNSTEKSSLALEHFMGIESGFPLDREPHVLAVICRQVTLLLGFEARDAMVSWETKIRDNMAEDRQFLVQVVTVPTKSRLPTGPARLHLQNRSFCVSCGIPPRVLHSWQLHHLRRFGVINGRFLLRGRHTLRQSWHGCVCAARLSG
ncbi:PREDICTED: protein Dok-7-like, partial [Priapulus caudatus]|uniref:Protein Dok-7-like n=1 Tax=Priapulus caudatus TaxID=37621 RepID=A0ABM1F1W6_PRICU